MDRLPTVFLSHGAPTFALEPGLAGPQLAALGRSLPRPRAVLVVSPHWMAAGPLVGAAESPATVHDFGGFEAALYALQYPAPGHPQLAHRTQALLQAAGWPTRIDTSRGLDHGAWVPLMHLFPEADVPVFQVALPAAADAEAAWALGRALAPLADEGVLIVGSGSLTHNLHDVFGGGGAQLPYAHAFRDWVRAAALGGDRRRLLRTMDEAPEARRAHPTTEHYWPLLVAAGAAAPDAPARLLDGGTTYGVLVMDGFVFGAAPGLAL